MGHDPAQAARGYAPRMAAPPLAPAEHRTRCSPDHVARHVARHVALHVAGFAASSWLLERVARLLPGFDTSRLAGAIATAQAAAAATNAQDWIRLVLRDAVVPATLEELLFRGLFYAILRRSVSVPAAIVGTAVLFGLTHLDLHHALVATLLGLQLGLLRERFGLGPAWLAHATNNVLAVSVSGVSADWRTTGLAIALCGISNAALLQGMSSANRARAAVGSPASGDSRM